MFRQHGSRMAVLGGNFLTRLDGRPVLGYGLAELHFLELVEELLLAQHC